MPTGTLQFGEYCLDCDRFQLRRSSIPLRLERKPLELLILLASSNGRLVGRDEIARCLWPSEVFVDTEHGINTAIRKIRYALREDPGRPRFLETVPGKGYRFIGVTAPLLPGHAPEEQGIDGALSTVAEQEPEAKVPLPEGRVSQEIAVPLALRGSRTRRVWLVCSVLIAGLVALVFLTVTSRPGAARKPVENLNPAAVEAYQRGHYLWFSNHQEAAGPYFLKATQIQPDYALAWAGLSAFYGAQMVNGVLDPRQTLPLADAAAHRADQLDDSLAESHLALAGSDWTGNWDFSSALHELDRALELDPKLTEAHHLRAKLLAQLNRHEEALAEQRWAMQLNPFERPWALGNDLVLARRYDEAIVEARSRLEGTTNGRFWRTLSQAYAAKGMQNEAEKAREQALTSLGDTAAAQAVHRAYLRGGQRRVLLWMLEDLKSQSQTHYVAPYKIAILYAELGNRGQALDALEETARQHSPMVLDIQNDFAFDGLHSEPRFRALVQNIGLPPCWK